jgi:hypothetical protein
MVVSPQHFFTSPTDSAYRTRQVFVLKDQYGNNEQGEQYSDKLLDFGVPLILLPEFP